MRPGHTKNGKEEEKKRSVGIWTLVSTFRWGNKKKRRMIGKLVSIVTKPSKMIN